MKAAIETVLAERSSLVYCRVLFGLPHRQVLKDHLLARLRSTTTTGRWSLYWRDRHLRFHAYDRYATTVLHTNWR